MIQASPQSRRLNLPIETERGISSVMLFWLVFGAISFNLLLCFIHTHFFGVSNLHVMAFEAAIISCVLLAAYRSINHSVLIILACTVLWALTLASLRVVIGSEDAIDIKIVRDLTIPIAFFLLGTRVASLRDADRLVFISAILVLAFALFEYFWVETFTRVFNVASYYIARGTMEAKDALQSGDLFISGVRPEAASAGGGRNLLPFLGGHRVSSVFLEPVSIGNFGVIVFMWGLVRSKFDRAWHFAPMLLGISLVILADSRFGAYLCILAVAMMLLPTAIASLGAISFPLIGIVILIIVPIVVTGSYDPQNRYADNTFTGRFVLSGQILGEFELLSWMGLKPPHIPAFDSGYAYIITGIGALGAAAAWLLFFSIRGQTQEFYAFRNLAALYYGLILCVSNSPFTIKSASILWVLIGALSIGGRAMNVRQADIESTWAPRTSTRRYAGQAGR